MDAENPRQWLADHGVPQLMNQMVQSALMYRPDDTLAFFQEFLETSQKDVEEEPSLDFADKSQKAMKRAFTQNRKFDWKRISKTLCFKKTPEETAQRQKLWALMDMQGNNYLSLAEVDKGLRDVLKLPEIFDAKPVIMRAFQAAKNINVNSRAALGADLITKSEFRILLLYLRRYLELFVMFDRTDSNDDRRVDKKEFAAAAQSMEKWGVKVFYAELQFKAIDKNGGGFILFDEFCEWAIQQQLNVEDKDDLQEFSMADGADPNGGQLAKKMLKGRKISVNWQEIAAKLPTNANIASERAKRWELFRLFDVNGNNYLSLAEVDKGVRDVLCIDELFDCKPALMRAFQAAKVANPKSRAALGEDYITHSEFRLLLVYLQRYFQLFVKFASISNDEHRINLEEFTKALTSLEHWGIKPKDAKEEFKKIDKNGGGQVLFDEFCIWALESGLRVEASLD